MPDHRICIAPMMDHTDKHFRYFMRLLSKNTLLYTEMITTGAIIHGKRDELLDFNEVEHPVAIQLGGSAPDELAQCAKIAEDKGYNEINLNIGCPSDRVQNGQFGACLMQQPELVADCVARIRGKTNLPVTVKTRIGIDDNDSYAFLKTFIATVKQAGCDTFILHARKAILNGLSPKQNREIPALNYDRVYQLKQDYPSLNIIINGGIRDIEEVKQHLSRVDGVMLGRVAFEDPYILSDVDQYFYQQQHKPDRKEILEQYRDYVCEQTKKGAYPKTMTRHVTGLFRGQPGARKFRQLLSDTKPASKTDMTYFDDSIRFIHSVSE